MNFNCQFQLKTWGDLGEIYVCLATAEATTSSTTLEEVSGNHLSGRSNSDVRAVQTYQSPEFTRIPLGMENFFPDLLVIQFWNGNLTSVTAEDLKPYPNLRYLSLPVNHITTLDVDLFKFTTKIKDFVIPSNKIERVGENIFAFLPELRWVNFLSNPCFSYYADTPEQLQYLKSNLASRCPPLQTSTTVSTTISTTLPSTTTSTTSKNPDECEIPIRCSINEEMDDTRIKIILQSNLIEDLTNTISTLSARTLELEKQMREINARP